MCELKFGLSDPNFWEHHFWPICQLLRRVDHEKKIFPRGGGDFAGFSRIVCPPLADENSVGTTNINRIFSEKCVSGRFEIV